MHESEIVQQVLQSSILFEHGVGVTLNESTKESLEQHVKKDLKQHQ